MRWYLPNIARFPSVDPITEEYPELTPYQFASNTPINSIDLDGLEKQEIIDAFKWGARQTAKLAKETVEGVGQLIAHPINTGKAGIKNLKETGGDWGTMASTGAQIMYGTVTNTEIHVDTKEFDAAAQRIAKGIVKTGVGAVGGTAVGGGLSTVTKAAKSRIIKAAKPHKPATVKPSVEKPKCFIAGTLVYTLRGLIPIEQIVVGDSVLTSSETTEWNSWNRVAETFKNEAIELTRIVTSFDTIFATSGHRFFTNLGWIQAGDLHSKLFIRTSLGKFEPILNVVIRDTVASVYNIKVEINHNYFITPNLLLVHNGDCDKVIHKKSFDEARETAFDKAGMTDPEGVQFTKVDPKTGTVVEFKHKNNGAKVNYDSPHADMDAAAGHDKPHVGWQGAGKNKQNGRPRGNVTYDGSQHPHCASPKGTGVVDPH